MSFHTTSTISESLEPRRLLSIGYDWGLGGGCSGKAEAAAVVADADGSVYVLGRFSGTIDVDPGGNQVYITALGDSDLFLIKYSAGRKLIWAKSAGGADGNYFPTAMSINPNGGLAIVGSFTGTVDLALGAGDAPATSTGGEDAFIIQTASEGEQAVHTFFGGPYYDAIRTVDASRGYPIVGGVFTKSIRFPHSAGVTESAGGKDGFVGGYIYDADVNTFYTIGGSGYDAVNQIYAGASNLAISVVGSMEATATFGLAANASSGSIQFTPVVLNSHGGKDAFYLRYGGISPSGFAQRYGGDGDDWGVSMAVENSSAFIGGTFNKPMNGLTSTGGTDVFVQKIEGSNRAIGSTADDAAGKLALDTTGRLIVTGTYGASMTFNNISLRDEGKTDVFMATYDDTFTPETIIGLGGQYTDTATGLATAPGGAVYLAGSFRNWFDLGPGDISASIFGNANGEFYLDRLIVA